MKGVHQVAPQLAKVHVKELQAKKKNKNKTMIMSHIFKPQNLIQAIVILCLFLLTGCKKDPDSKQNPPNPPTDKEWVMINGVKWATRNVGVPGKFVSSYLDYGNFYNWEEVQNVCPEGWRLPTCEEAQSLVNSGYKWVSDGIDGIEGMIFGSGNNAIFMSYAGYAGSSSRVSGMYWTAAPNGAYGILYLGSTPDLLCSDDTANPGGFSINVRCVAK